MQKTLTLRVLPQIAAQDRELRRYVAGEMAIDARTICGLRIRRRSIDARQRTIYVNLTVDVYVNETAPEIDFAPIEYPHVSRGKQAIVVGAGPAGLFAALRLIELGLVPLCLSVEKTYTSVAKTLPSSHANTALIQRATIPLAKAALELFRWQTLHAFQETRKR